MNYTKILPGRQASLFPIHTFEVQCSAHVSPSVTFETPQFSFLIYTGLPAILTNRCTDIPQFRKSNAGNCFIRKNG